MDTIRFEKYSCCDLAWVPLVISTPPDVMPKFKWEDAMSVDKYSWGYRRTATIGDLNTVDDLISLLVKTVR